ncbi:UTRA domain-containing protein [Sphingopyxis sp. FD7]|jgi:GntR family histidine utilization transcriptional repressor|uniref:UTRA domain-containing protein n=1 Tax=Sphingopyxis sp. FD7 TaxID=1914525 RepID=UPI000DC63132|nr:UTRA domain-containing protein [Sphingopyxis sp. FD7]BBB12700.1 GntR family transcriptional regulator [Sphingopyxis sp. FD7]
MNPARRIRDEIAAAIRSGEWRPGDRVPTEQELAARHGCARATVSKALGELAAAGLVERRRKAGTFVAHPPVHSAVMAVPDLAELIAARGEAYRWSLNAMRIESDGVAQCPPPALRVEGIHFAAGEAFALETRFIALDEVPDAANADFRAEAPGTWLLGHIPWTEARHVIRAVTPTRSEAAQLGVTMRAACLELDRTTWRAGRVVTHVRQLFRGDRFDLVAEFNAGT